MKTLIWDNSFKRAFKRVVRKNPRLEGKFLKFWNCWKLTRLQYL